MARRRKKKPIPIIIAVVIAFIIAQFGISGDFTSTLDKVEDLFNSTFSTSENQDPGSTNEGAPFDTSICRLIEVDGGDRSGEREPLAAVDIGFGDREYWAYTNEHGQLVYVTADVITLQDDDKEPVTDSGRYYHDEANVPGCESPVLDQGHVIADSLGGVSNAYNITPQDSTLNRHGDQAYMEEVIRKAGGCTDFIAIITYPNTNTHTPSHYEYHYTVKGNDVVDSYPNANPEK